MSICFWGGVQLGYRLFGVLDITEDGCLGECRQVIVVGPVASLLEVAEGGSNVRDICSGECLYKRLCVLRRLAPTLGDPFAHFFHRAVVERPRESVAILIGCIG